MKFKTTIEKISRTSKFKTFTYDDLRSKKKMNKPWKVKAKKNSAEI